MRNGSIATVFWITAAFFLGCETPAPTGAWDPAETTLSSGSHSLSEGAGILALVNEPTTTIHVLDHGIGLDKRAAEAIVDHRDGWDGKFGTQDDNPFDTLEELDGIPYVGPAAMSRLKSYALEWGWVPVEDDYLGTWKTVAFTVTEAEWTLAFVNDCDQHELDHELGLTKIAAKNIVAAKPIVSINQLANIAYVGGKTLTVLRDVSAAYYGASLTVPVLEGDVSAGTLAPESELEWAEKPLDE